MNSHQNNQGGNAPLEPKNIRLPAALGISIERVREAIDFEPSTGVMRWTDRSAVKPRVFGKVCGSVMRDGYRRVTLDHVFFLQHRLAWAHYYGEWPKGQIDHINRVKSDNRICNLRLATPSQNTANQAPSSRNRHGLKGVTPIKNGKWQAAIGVNGATKYLGSFDTKEAANACYEAASRASFGEFAFKGSNP